MTESYGQLTVGSVVGPGKVAIGERVTGAGIPPLTAVDAAGPGGTWIVDNAISASGNITMTAPTFTVEAQQYTGATQNNDFFEIQPNGVYGFDMNPSSLSFASGSAADLLGLSQASGAINSSPGGIHESIAQYMDSVLNELNQFGQPVHFGSFQSFEPRLDTNLAAWANSIGGLGYQFLANHFATPPAGSSLPVTDPAGTYSPAGTGVPTFASPVNTIVPHIYKGPFGNETNFDTAVDALTNTSTSIKDEANLYEADVWGTMQRQSMSRPSDRGWSSGWRARPFKLTCGSGRPHPPYPRAQPLQKASSNRRSTRLSRTHSPPRRRSTIFT